MNLFLDTSVVLAAIGSKNGASRFVTNIARRQNWSLFVSDYVIRETELNLKALSFIDQAHFHFLKSTWIVVKDVVTFEWVTIFEKSKDRPILFSASAYKDVLLTLDHADFGTILNMSIYGLEVLKPRDFLQLERKRNRLAHD